MTGKFAQIQNSVIRSGPWTSDEDDLLRALAGVDERLDVIAKSLCRSVGSVRMRASRLKIPLVKPGKLTRYPVWLKLSDDRTSFVYVPDRAAIVRNIFELSAAGLGGYTIANQLNAKNVPSFGPSPKWDQSTIHNMLRNRATIGEYQPKRYATAKERPSGTRDRKGMPAGAAIPGFYPAIIDEALFDAAQKARRDNLISGRGRKGRLITNLFGRIPTCAYCGASVKFYSNGPAKSMICSSVLNRHGCYRTAWSYRDFEKSFFELLKKLASDPTIERRDEKAISELLEHVTALSGLDVYGARLVLSMKLKAIVEDIRVASAGSAPVPIASQSRIRRDMAGRYLEITFKGGSTHRGFAGIR